MIFKNVQERANQIQEETRDWMKKLDQAETGKSYEKENVTYWNGS